MNLKAPAIANSLLLTISYFGLLCAFCGQEKNHLGCTVCLEKRIDQCLLKMSMEADKLHHCNFHGISSIFGQLHHVSNLIYWLLALTSTTIKLSAQEPPSWPLHPPVTMYSTTMHYLLSISVFLLASQAVPVSETASWQNLADDEPLASRNWSIAAWPTASIFTGDSGNSMTRVAEGWVVPAQTMSFFVTTPTKSATSVISRITEDASLRIDTFRITRFTSYESQNSQCIDEYQLSALVISCSRRSVQGDRTSNCDYSKKFAFKRLSGLGLGIRRVHKHCFFYCD